MTLAAGRYRFTVTTDDGSRLWVDEQLRINAWWAQTADGPTRWRSTSRRGAHTLRCQYVEQTGGATAQLTWALLTPVVQASGEALWETPDAGVAGRRVSAAVLGGPEPGGGAAGGRVVRMVVADERDDGGHDRDAGRREPVIYNGDWIPVWNTGTAGYDGARLEIANHTMAIVGPDGTTRCGRTVDRRHLVVSWQG